MRRIWVAVYVIGFTSMLAQLTLLRQLLNVFQGNELAFGLIVGFWTFFIGAGSLFAGKKGLKGEGLFAFTMALAVIILPLTVFSAKSLIYSFTTRGEMPGLLELITSTIATVSAYGFLYGIQLSVAASILGRDETAQGVSKTYIIDSVGDVTGGLIFSFVLVNFLNGFQTIYIACAANIFGLYLISKKYIKHCITLSLVVFSLVFFLDLNQLANSIQYSGQEVLVERNTKYGNIVLTNTSGQINVYENGAPLFSTGQIRQAEELIHYPMLQIEQPERVLLVSGGVSGTIREILKYDIKSLDYVELDPELVGLARDYIRDESLNDQRVNYVFADGRLFVKKTRERYDAVIIDLPDPTTAQLNRFYTIEFFEEVRKILNEKGVLATTMTSSENYMSKEIKELNSGIHSTLNEVFEEVVVLPGSRNIYLASSQSLTDDIASKLIEHKFEGIYVKRHFLSGIHTRERIDSLEDEVSEPGEINRDFKPIGYMQQFRYWLSLFNLRINEAVVLLALASVILYIRLKPLQANVLTVGFTGTSLEIVILLSFQALYGYVYHQVGLIVTAFMAGLVCSAVFVTSNIRNIGVKHMKSAVFALSVYAVALAYSITAFKTFDSGLLVFISSNLAYIALTFALGFLVGSVFPIAAKTMSQSRSASEVAGTLYSLDLLGAFFGNVLASVFLIPYLGLVDVCILIFLVNIIGYFRIRHER